MIWMCTACALLGLSVGMPDSIAAQQPTVPDVRVSLVADRDELTVGDLLTLTLEVTYPADHVVVLPKLQPDWGPFEVRTQTSARTVATGDSIWATHVQYQVTLFALGEFETPVLFVSVRGSDGITMQVPVPAVRVTVRSVLSGNDDPLRDIRSHADLSKSFWERPTTRAVAVLFALAVIGASAFFVRQRRRRRETPPEQAVDTRTPFEIATQEIDRIERLDLSGSGNFVEHYTLISALIRAYIQAMHFDETDGLSTERMTTDEIEASLRLSSLEPGRYGLVRDLLIEADIVKYSGYTPPAVEAREALEKARTFVYQDMPKSASHPGEGAPGGQEAPA